MGLYWNPAAENTLSSVASIFLSLVIFTQSRPKPHWFTPLPMPWPIAKTLNIANRKHTNLPMGLAFHLGKQISKQRAKHSYNPTTLSTFQIITISPHLSHWAPPPSPSLHAGLRQRRCSIPHWCITYILHSLKIGKEYLRSHSSSLCPLQTPTHAPLGFILLWQSVSDPYRSILHLHWDLTYPHRFEDFAPARVSSSWLHPQSFPLYWIIPTGLQNALAAPIIWNNLNQQKSSWALGYC